MLLYTSIPLIILLTNFLRSAGFLSANPLSSDDNWDRVKKLASKLNRSKIISFPEVTFQVGFNSSLLFPLYIWSLTCPLDPSDLTGWI